MSGPKPKVTDEQIRERCWLADERGEPLQAVADDLHIALRILSKRRRRLGRFGPVVTIRARPLVQKSIARPALGGGPSLDASPPH